MPLFRISFEELIVASVEVEADNEEQAIAKFEKGEVINDSWGQEYKGVVEGTTKVKEVVD